MKTAIYTRVSTDKEEQKLSLKEQRRYYTDYCNKNDYELYDIYADEGITGTKRNRKEFVKMLIDAGLDPIRNKSNAIVSFENSDREPKFNFILMKDITRFSRNLNILDTVRLLRLKGVHLIFESVNLSTAKDGWESEFAFYLLFSQRESQDKSEKLKWTYKRRKENNKWHMSTPLFGYEYDKDKNEYIINEDEAMWVRKIFDMYINDLEGTKNIASFLNENKIKTRRGKEWRADGVKRLITNEKYMGLVIIGRITNPEVTAETKTRIKIDEEYWNKIENGIAPIIDKETFNKAQEVLNNRVKQMADGSKKGSRKVKSLFYQKITCSKCGSFFTRVKGNKVKNGEKVAEYNYFCLNRRTLKNCDMRGVSHNVLVRELQKMIDIGLIRNLILKTSGNGDKGKEENLFKQLLMEIDNQRSDATNKINEIQTEIDEISKKADKLYNVIYGDNVSEMMLEMTKKKISQLGEEQKQLEIKKTEFTTASLDRKERLIKDYYQSMIQFSSKKTFTVEELIKWIVKIEVHEDRNLHFYFKFPSLFRLQTEDVFLPDEIGLAATRFDVKY